MADATLQGVLNHHFDVYADIHPLPVRQREVCGHIRRCRTEVMGGLHLKCGHCQDEKDHYYSCRDRHCPLCQQAASQQWSERQLTNLLPTSYFHLVFTLPHTLNGWMRLHPKVIYRLLFQSAWETLKQFGQDPRWLGGELGMTAALHTWGQTLDQHVHLHCLVPGGALTEEGRWNPAKSNYLFPVRALSRCFRGKMVSKLRQSVEQGELPRITNPGEPKRTLDRLMENEWVVYSKHCLKHTGSVLEYLARYSHRGAISNRRILSDEASGITFRYKDYRNHEKSETMVLSPDEFIRRILQHILPKGFMRMRHYGFLANCCRKRKRPLLLEALKRPPPEKVKMEKAETYLDEIGSYPCQKCHKGRLRVVWEVMPVYRGSG